MASKRARASAVTVIFDSFFTPTIWVAHPQTGTLLHGQDTSGSFDLLIAIVEGRSHAGAEAAGAYRRRNRPGHGVVGGCVCGRCPPQTGRENVGLPPGSGRARRGCTRSAAPRGGAVRGPPHH